MIIHCKEIIMVPIGDLKPHPKNRNKHSKLQVERLAKIIKYQGWRNPIRVSNRSGFITGGHCRLLSAKLLKLTHVPVSFQDYDSDEQEILDLNADNAIATWAEIEMAEVSQDLADLGPDLDVDLMGYEDLKIDVSEKDYPQNEKIDLTPQFIVAIQCTSEDEMAKLFDEMSARGFQCKLIT